MLKILSIQTKTEKYTDAEVVHGLQQNDRRTEEWFYTSGKRYFDAHFNEVFFDKDKKQEIFQMAFLKLWTEIENGKIRILDGVICRQQKDGNYKAMTCKLKTFLMTFAKNEYRELVRSNHLDTYAELYDSANNSTTDYNVEEDAEELKNRIVDDCIQTMSPRCIEVLTLFYYKGKSLDEIMEIRQENTSKNGLKTAKNKCMTTLRERVLAEYERLIIN